MAERIMLALGEFRFEIATAAYQKLAYSQSWRWPEQARITREPALQFMGKNAAEIDLEGVIYPSFQGGLSQIETLRTMADRGEPLSLVDGLGRVWDRWVITELSDTRTLFTDDGQPRKLEFRLKLKAYGEDESFTDLAAGWDPFAVTFLDLLSGTGIDELLDEVEGVVGDVVGEVEAVIDDVLDTIDTLDRITQEIP